MADGMFNYTDPRLLQQAYQQQFSLTPQQMASLPLLNQVAAIGGNAGASLGTNLGRLFGGQTALEAENEVLKDIFTKASQASTDPIERMTIAAQALRDKGLEGRAQQLEEQIQKALQAQRQGRLTEAQTDAATALAEQRRRPDETGGGSSAGGTGPERMATFVANIQARLAAGEDVPLEERLRAQNFASVLSKEQFFKMPDGSVIGVPKNDFGAIRQRLNEGGEPINVGSPSTVASAPSAPAPAPQQTTAPTPSTQAPAPAASGGARVIETPESQANRRASEQGVQNQIDTISADLNNINEALSIVGPGSAGIAGILGIFPQTDARRVQKLIEGIDAAKVFNELTKLREASSTGASGLGQVTEREISLLQNRLRVLDPYGDPAKLREDLQYIADAWTKIQDRLKASQQPQQGQQPQQPQQQTSPRAGNDAIIDRVMADPRNRGRTRAQVEQALRQRGIIQ